jgi:hypothetical protein
MNAYVHRQKKKKSKRKNKTQVKQERGDRRKGPRWKGRDDL